MTQCKFALLETLPTGWFRYKCSRCGLETGPTPHAADRVFAECRKLDPSVVVPASGPGAELKKLLEEVGLLGFAGCGCELMAQQMDVGGRKWCEANRTEITEHLRAAADRLGWYQSVLVGGALLQQPWFSLLDRFGSLVDESLRRAAAAE